MKLITRWTLAAEAAGRWRQQYGNRPLVLPRYPDVQAALDALGPAPNPDDVDRIIGNTSWTEVGACHECGRAADALVEVGEEPDRESNTAHLCGPCLLKALQLIDGP